jgi:hypothetical protein
MRILFHEYGTQLRLEDDGRLVLDVLCGRVFQYGVEFSLNDSEREQYKIAGDSFIKELAQKVLNDPETFGMRGRFC